MTAFMEQIKNKADSLVNSGLTTGLTVAFGNKKKSAVLCSGYTDEQKSMVLNKSTVFDLASVTKLFLTFAFFRFAQQNSVDFEKSVEYYCADLFPFIKDLTLDDLFHFNCSLVTDRRISDCSYEEAKNQIYNIKPKPFEKPIYSDMPSLVLGFIFKEISGVEFGNFINSELINKYVLNNTFWGADIKKTNNYMNYDNELVIKDGLLVNYAQTPLTVNDSKAAKLSCGGKYLCGNAGLFSTAEDIIKISEILISRDFLSDNSLMKIATNYNTKYLQRFGYLSYCKSPDEMLSEVYCEMSDNTFAISGFTGTYYMVDPINNCYLFIGGNRLNNKVTFTDNKDLLTDKTHLVFNGKTYAYTKDYVYIKDDLRNECCKYLLNCTK